MKQLICFLASCSLIAFTTGCGGGASHQPTELHDQKGEHLNYPAGGPNSPDAKKAAAKSSEPPKTEAKKS